MSILNKLTIKHLTMNKKRTIVTIIGIVLSTALMVGIGLLFSSVRDYTVREVRETNGSFHASIYKVRAEKLSIIENNINVDKVFYEKGIGFSYLENPNNEYKPYLFINSVNSYYLNELNLIDGRMPKNDSELVISNHIKNESGFEYKIGDVIELEIGLRSKDDDYIQNDSFLEGETLNITQTKKYTIVGVVLKSVYESYDSAGYSVFTLNEKLDNTDFINTYIVYNKVKNVYDKTEEILKNIEISQEMIKKNPNIIGYNDSLLTLYGENRYDNFNGTVLIIMVIMLSLVSVGCIIVIYNSFAISVMERKKQFGLFSSIGTTRSQLRKTVFFEAFIVGLIGIILGVVSALFGIWVVLQITNSLIKDVFTYSLNLSIYPLFILIPIIFMIVVIIISAYIPASKASRISPIQAIRQNDDIKIKGKKVKTNKFIKKIFGMEGEIALKNIKRNKRKYRITIASLFISIVLFVSFSGFLKYGLSGSEDFMNLPEFEFAVFVQDQDDNETNTIIDDVTVNKDVDKYSVFQSYVFEIEEINSNNFTDEYKKIIGNRNIEQVNIIVPSDKTYQNYLNEINVLEEKIIFINRAKGILYQNNNRQSYDVNIMKKDNELSFILLKFNETNLNEEVILEIDDFYETDKFLFGTEATIDSSIPTIVMSKTLLESSLIEEDIGYTILIDANDNKSVDKRLNELKENSKMNYFYFTNIEEELKLQRNLILVLKILLYGFISLVTLIGVTSVFNTINTSIALRRKEFAVLRSIGLTPRGFNRIIYFESIFFGIKSLFYALPVSFGIVYLIHRSMQDLTYNSKILIPWEAVIISIFAVFIIVLITMMYSSKKIKRENILDAIREENI